MLKRFKNKNKKYSNGFMMIEVVVAASIMVISILAAMSVAQKTITLSERNIHNSQANFLLEEGAEAMKVIRNNGWSNISSLDPTASYNLVFSGNTWTLVSSDTPTQIGSFSRRIRVSTVKRDTGTGDISDNGTIDTGTMMVTTTVSWIENGVAVDKTLSFYIADIFS